MQLRDSYERFLSYRREQEKDPLFCRYVQQTKRYIPPFRVYGDIYYVGDSWVCAHLIDTGDGLLLLDGGNCGATAMLIDSVWRLGFDPADIRWLILSHGHVDHFGAACYLQEMYGTKVYLGKPDAQMLKRWPEQSLLHCCGDVSQQLVVPDHTISDGDQITFGKLKVQFYLVPGHTVGCIACFFDMAEDGISRHVGYYGGFGLNTLQKEFLLQVGDPDCQMRRLYLESVETVRDMPVDVFLGNHVMQNEYLEKYLLVGKGPNPFIDPTAWKRCLDGKRDEMLALMKREGQPFPDREQEKQK